MSGVGVLDLSDGSPFVPLDHYCTVPRAYFSVGDPLSWPLRNDTTWKPASYDIPQKTLGTDNPEVADYIVRKHNCLRSRVYPRARNMLQLEWNANATQKPQEWVNRFFFCS